MTYQAKDARVFIDGQPMATDPVEPPAVEPIHLEIALEVLPPDDGGREFVPYGRQALGRRKDVPFTCE